MKRRTILARFGAAATRPPFAQQPGRTYRVGIISYLPSRKLLQIVSLLEGLQSMGFVEGQNLAIDEYSFNLPVDQMADAARRMVEAKAPTGRARPTPSASWAGLPARFCAARNR